jgi:26S proteasome regulatory subunit T5
MDIEQEVLAATAAAAAAQDPNAQQQPQEEPLPEEFLSMTAEQVSARVRLLENEIRVLKDESTRLNLDAGGLKERVKENREKIKLNNQLPYLVGNIVEVLDVSPDGEGQDGEEEDGAAADLDAQRRGKCVVLKTSTRQTVFLPVVGLVDADKLRPGDLVGVNKDSYLVLDTLPAEYDSRVKAMEVDEKPTEDYSSIGGLDKQIQELVEAIVLPIQHKDRFEKLGIRPPKGVLCYGPPGTGKTLIARACAAQTNATFLKLAGPQLVQMFIGDGAKMVRDAFALAKEKQPAIIFIDEIDAIGTKRFDSELSGDREVQRTMLELLNQLGELKRDQRRRRRRSSARLFFFSPPRFFCFAHRPSRKTPAKQKNRRLLLERQRPRHRRHQPRRHPRPGAHALGTPRPQDRIPPPQRRRPRENSAHPLAAHVGGPWCGLAGAGAQQRRLQRGAAEGGLRRSGHVGSKAGRDDGDARGLCGGDRGGGGEEEGDADVLRLRF